MTAEFAAVMPAVIVVLGACLAGVQVSAQQLRVVDAAALAARVVARGEGASAAADVASNLVAGSRVEIGERGRLVCVTVSARAAAAGPLALGALSATSCSLAGG